MLQVTVPIFFYLMKSENERGRAEKHPFFYNIRKKGKNQGFGS